jgi:thiamine pyrophosphate-dependent acetolactate synthase large subunit-like protein
MSLSYAGRLQKGIYYGEVGQPEFLDSERIKSNKVEKIINLIKKSKKIVIFTGAGISTSMGIRYYFFLIIIRDFR